MSALSERLADAKGDRSIDAIADQAGRRGHRIDRATVGRYIQGKHAKRPPDQVLVALAEGLGIDVRELRTLAGVPEGELGQYEPPAESARLSRRQREALDELIKAIVSGESDAQKIDAVVGGRAARGGRAPVPATDTFTGDGDSERWASSFEAQELPENADTRQDHPIGSPETSGTVAPSGRRRRKGRAANDQRRSQGGQPS